MPEVRKTAGVHRSLTDQAPCDVMIVADRGMVGKKNMEALSSLGFTYILGVKMRLEKRAMADVLSRAGRFSEVEPNLKVKEVTHEGKRFIVCINLEEQKKDRLAREAIVSQLKTKLKRGAALRLPRKPSLKS